MERLTRTTSLEVGQTIVMVQNGINYFYDVLEIINDINLDLKNDRDLFLNISLTGDGFFTTLEEYENQ